MLPFQNLNSITSCQITGHEWVRTASQAALQVPSVVIPEEFNILLNPIHPDCANIEWREQCLLRLYLTLFVVTSLPL